MDQEVYDSTSDSELVRTEQQHVPECDAELIPKIGQNFIGLLKGQEFYESYATAAGFSTRKSTIKLYRDGTVRSRMFVCSFEGKKTYVCSEEDEDNNTPKTKRRRFSRRTGCQARIQFYWKGCRGFVITKFVEPHNHSLASGGYRSHLKNARNVDIGHQSFVARCAKANIGPARSFRIFKELVGGYDEVGCKKVDFKNLSRDIKIFGDGMDVKLLLDKFRRLRSKNKDFFFDFCVDDSKRLTRLFWADPVSVVNYKIFGESISFDATYQTNRYDLIFTPFTGWDNYGKCITFGAGLISQENAESYYWLLSKFLECMGTPPVTFITDQDLGLRAAVPKVFPDTRHRFCMWHIMMKVPDKIPVALRGNEEFSKSFKQIVYSNNDEPEVFEAKWLTLMNQYELVGNTWFQEMYTLRKNWIPAYFRDVKMSGLFRTTSLSESENNFFKLFLKKRSNISHLYMLFESAMESQRDDHDGRTLADQTRTPEMITKIDIERHAATQYTSTIFHDVQKEIEAAVMFCDVEEKAKSSVEIIYNVEEDASRIFDVTYVRGQDQLSCDCKMFTRMELVCRHMFAVMKKMKYKAIPEKYIVKRWTKKACSIFDDIGQNRFASDVGNINSGCQRLFALANKCVALAEGDDELAKELTQILNGFMEKNSNIEQKELQKNGKQKILETLYGISNDDGEDVLPPNKAKPKGSCSTMVKKKVAAIEKAKKPKRVCRKCGELGHHDSRNCDKVKDKQ